MEGEEEEAEMSRLKLTYLFQDFINGNHQFQKSEKIGEAVHVLTVKKNLFLQTHILLPIYLNEARVTLLFYICLHMSGYYGPEYKSL